ncbi:unnamed protein product [Nyctereutes procyonoides]|uniref:(raccoon dog) hypothetical protein n=1 Tax=Nyctereutes procyonoides TaxID=34880 RepID=A0A811ZDF8_NYCPR|nr:unnamed protein product [Nyctereutes procyonoides]
MHLTPDFSSDCEIEPHTKFHIGRGACLRFFPSPSAPPHLQDDARFIHQQWRVMENCSRFLIKRNKMCRSEGLIHHKTVDTEPVTDGKGVLTVIKHRTRQQKPATSYMWTTIDMNAQATFCHMAYTIHENKHHSDLCMESTPRASAILGSQREVVMVKRKLTHPPRASEHNPQCNKAVPRFFNQSI